MPRNYKRKTDRQSWSEYSMQRAIEAVRKKEMGWLLASKTFGVPQATLRRHALGNNKTLESNSKGLGCWKPTFPYDVERQLVQHLKFLESRLFGLTRASVQELAFQFAEKNNFAHKFNPQKQKAGQEWMEGFLKRNKDISLRKPEPTSAARAQAFNRPQVKNFFQLYEKLLESVDYKPHRIYNADESGLSTVQKPQKILATTGRKQVGVITSAERGINTTIVCCVNAIGTFVPPMMIFQRKNMKNELVDEAPPGTLGVAQQSGWMTTEIFLKWIKHFQNFVKASNDDKVILILDGHASHKGIGALEYAKQNGIIIICLPPTHRMQPLDVTFFAPLKTYFNLEISKWLKAHPGRVVTQLQISGLFKEAYGKAATVQNGCNGFKSAGIWPLNPDVFPEYMYEPAETTNRPLENIPNEQLEQPTTSGNISNAGLSKQSHDIFTAGPSKQPQNDTFLLPATNILQVTPTTQSQCKLHVSMQQADNNSYQIPVSNILQNAITKRIPQDNCLSTDKKERALTSSTLSVSIEELSPAPKGKFISGQGKRKPKTRQTSLVLTSTPNMEDIKLKNKPKDPPVKRKRHVSKRLVKDDSEEENLFNTEDDDLEDSPCIYCNDLYSHSRAGEDWVRCNNCSHWAHAACADVPKTVFSFICELCK